MSKWKPIKSAPRDGTKIDVWLHIYASPRSMGMSDSFRTVDVFFHDGKWVHAYKDNPYEEIYSDYITHWMPISLGPKEG